MRALMTLDDQSARFERPRCVGSDLWMPKNVSDPRTADGWAPASNAKAEQEPDCSEHRSGKANCDLRPNVIVRAGERPWIGSADEIRSGTRACPELLTGLFHPRHPAPERARVPDWNGDDEDRGRREDHDRPSDGRQPFGSRHLRDLPSMRTQRGRFSMGQSMMVLYPQVQGDRWGQITLVQASVRECHP
jgi:hypothetical protein